MQIADYRLLPRSLTPAIARVVLCAELASGLMLLSGLLFNPTVRQLGAILAVALFVLFSIALGSALVRGAKIACACFGGGGELETVGLNSLVRTVLLLACAVLAGFSSSDGTASSAAALAVLFVVLVALSSELARVLGPLRHTTTMLIDRLAAESTTLTAEDTE